jgi:mRNA-degrading endonuclease HigB of HigAB toxin-antitoxin module
LPSNAAPGLSRSAKATQTSALTNCPTADGCVTDLPSIKGNKYRLVVRVNYTYRVVRVRFVGTHEDYDKLDVRKV